MAESGTDGPPWSVGGGSERRFTEQRTEGRDPVGPQSRDLSGSSVSVGWRMSHDSKDSRRLSQWVEDEFIKSVL